MRVCQSCGAKVSEAAKFCDQCGIKLIEAQKDNTDQISQNITAEDHSGQKPLDQTKKQEEPAVEELDLAVPVTPAERADRRAQLVIIQRPNALESPLAEHGEEVFKVEISNARQLQFQKRVLTRVHVDGMDVLHAGQRVVQGIAAGRGDHQHGVVGPELQRLAVEPRVLPAGVINEVVSVNEVEDSAAHPVDQRHTVFP